MWLLLTIWWMLQQVPKEMHWELSKGSVNRFLTVSTGSDEDEPINWLAFGRFLFSPSAVPARKSPENAQGKRGNYWESLGIIILNLFSEDFRAIRPCERGPGRHGYLPSSGDLPSSSADCLHAAGVGAASWLHHCGAPHQACPRHLRFGAHLTHALRACSALPADWSCEEYAVLGIEARKY